MEDLETITHSMKEACEKAGVLLVTGDTKVVERGKGDSAALHTLVDGILSVTKDVHCMRDPTRGGLASALNELATASRVGMNLREVNIPTSEEVEGACEILGLDPLAVANEGKLVAIVAPSGADEVLAGMRSHPLGRRARIIGEVVEEHSGTVVMETTVGGDADRPDALGGTAATHLLR